MLAHKGNYYYLSNMNRASYNNPKVQRRNPYAENTNSKNKNNQNHQFLV